MNFFNVYEDTTRASSYSKLQFPNTYYLAYRDLPDIIQQCFTGNRALDFGCGTGRSSRFLKKLGFDATGVDISTEMIEMAKGADEDGKYLLMEDDDLSALESDVYDLILSAFTFDNIPSILRRVNLLNSLKRTLKPQGHLILLDSTPEIYLHEWASFSTKAFPQNAYAQSGDIVQIIMKDVEDDRPVEDILWNDTDYRHIFASAGLDLIKTHYPLGEDSEPYEWINETAVAPWVIYVLKQSI
jgi:SAM-dependent methyltransferase